MAKLAGPGTNGDTTSAAPIGTAVGPRQPGGSRWSRRAWRENLAGYLLMTPWLFGFFTWIAFPMAISMYLTFTKYELFSPPTWVGLANFRELIHDDLVAKSLTNTIYYNLIGVPLHTAEALAVAVLLNQRVRGVGLFRTLFYIPSIVPAVATVIIWLWIFNPDFGLANLLLRSLGLPRQTWFFNARQALPLLILMSLWSFGPAMVLFLASLQSVPEALMEAARIDGANSWRCFWHITFPAISPVTFLNLITGFIGGLQVFTPAYVATSGGPANATLFYALYLYRVSIQYIRFGYGATLAWVLFAIILILTLAQLVLSRRWVYYETPPELQ